MHFVISCEMLNFRTLDLNLLRVFDALMSEGSLTRAASALAMTQPAASQALKRLHGAVGEPLFERVAYGMKPTARAEALWPQVREALAALQQALAPAEFNPKLDPVNFRIAMADATAAALAPALVCSIESERALASLQVLPLTTRDPRPLLQRDEADLAIGHFPVGRGASDAGCLLRRAPPAGQLLGPPARPGRPGAGRAGARAPHRAHGEPVLHRRARGHAVRPADRTAVRLRR